jgi:hypothetical protein
METIKLINPILIDGETVAECSYDMNLVTNGDYLAAVGRCPSNIEKPSNPVADYGFLFALGVQAILSANRDKNWTADDFKRVMGHDNWTITQIGYDFFTGRRAEQPESSSDE